MFGCCACRNSVTGRGPSDGVLYKAVCGGMRAGSQLHHSCTVQVAAGILQLSPCMDDAAEAAEGLLFLSPAGLLWCLALDLKNSAARTGTAQQVSTRCLLLQVLHCCHVPKPPQLPRRMSPSDLTQLAWPLQVRAGAGRQEEKSQPPGAVRPSHLWPV